MMRAYAAGATAAIVALLLVAAATLASPPPRAHAQTGCASTIDLMLVLDGSESIGWSEFDVMQTFVSDLVGQFTIGPADGHVGIVQFAGEGQGRVELALSDDASALQAVILDMAQIVGVTDIQEGIALGQGQLTLNGRPDVPHVLVLLTDGEHNQPGDPVAEAELARSLGTEIFAVAVGSGPNISELNAIATNPYSEHVFSVDAFDELVSILDPLVEIVCPPTPTPTATPTATSPAEQPPSPTESPPSGETPAPTDTPVDDVLGVTQLPEVGNGLPPELEYRGGHLLAQALGGVGGALLTLVATYWVARRRARR